MPQRLVEPLMKNIAINLDRSELAQVIGHKLRVQQDEVAVDQTGDQMHKSDLGSVALHGKHAFTEERGANGDTVKPANEMATLVPYGSGLDRRARDRGHGFGR